MQRVTHQREARGLLPPPAAVSAGPPPSPGSHTCGVGRGGGVRGRGEGVGEEVG